LVAEGRLKEKPATEKMLFESAPQIFTKKKNRNGKKKPTSIRYFI
jgi:hypothetical protein